ncbi:hypothetical protein EG240_10340 [Paenimyroides tangerinum]|uniref:TonB C-terminal domain-containing protein n=1 Tax=Paenimyroides tangerinum TaxID=2488728 RepID=A0A3P3W493_9FLAO|nr:hypothetical protein [Paenimyroides tangerinum]RRJ89911.1 hypothetical protein EG240_10340 [Paenimyroides tangerinum]
MKSIINKSSVCLLFIFLFLSPRVEAISNTFSFVQSQTDLINITYVNNRLSFGYFQLYENVYYYVILPDKTVSFYNNLGQKQISSNFQYRITEVSEEEKNSSLTNDVYDIFFQFEDEEIRRSFSRTEPVGGIKQLYTDFMRRFNAPELNSRNTKVNLVIKISVDSKGNLTDFIILNDADFKNADFKKEIFRVLKLLPKFNPAILNGVEVDSEYLFPLVINISIM